MAEKISSMTLYLLLGIGVLVFLMGMVGGSYEAMIYVSYLFSGIAVVGAIAASLMGALNKPESIKGSMISIGGMLLIVGVSYAMANGTIMDYYPKGTTESAVKWSDTGLYMLYILTFLTVASIVYAGVSSLIKK